MERRPINLSTSLAMGWLPAVGLGVAALGIVISAALAVTGIPAEDFGLPLLVMVGMGAAIAAIIGAFIGIGVAWQAGQIRRLLESPWATWPQYASEEEWRAARDKRAQEERDSSRLSFAPLIVLTVVFAFILGFLNFYYFPQNRQFMQPGDSTRVTLAVVGFFVLIGAAVSLTPIVGRMRANRRNAFRQTLRLPSVYIGRGGLYREDEGYESLGGLRAVTLRGGTLVFEITRWMRTGGIWMPVPVTLSVPVPATSKNEADMVMERFKREVL